MAEIHRTSLVTGLLALTGSGLYLLDDTGSVQVDEVVTAASLGIVLGTAGLIRSVTALVGHFRQADHHRPLP